jgi:UDP-N-acetylglucosamine--N-acetylmuramyl-(pentapeptide) pyrophosphoryl-undecaprenol N-acetylglucosamine transferase
MEPNSVIGLSNWLLAPFVDRAYTAFEPSERHFSPNVVRRLGVPLRQGFSPRAMRRQVGPLRVLVLGGSQGAKTLNEMVPEALSRIEGSLEVTHQAGAAHVDALAERYRSLGFPARVTPFIDDMPRALADADLVVSRAGASAVSEILAVGRPSLLVPYPFASGDHQRVNAETVERAGAARSLPVERVSVERLRSEIQLLVQDRGALLRMADAAQKLGRPDAATEVATDFLNLLGLEIR